MKSFKRSHLTVLACGIAVGLVSASCSSGGASPPNAYVTSTLGYAVDSEGNIVGHCLSMVSPDTPFLDIGTEGNPVPTGGNYMGVEVTVVCQVQSTGTDTYAVNAQITQGTQGSFTFSGTLTNTMDPQPMFQGGFDKGDDGYSSTACTVQLNAQGFDSTGAPKPSSPSITAGRVWATLSCPMLTNLEANATCGGQATFILQNCSD